MGVADRTLKTLRLYITWFYCFEMMRPYIRKRSATYIHTAAEKNKYCARGLSRRRRSEEAELCICGIRQLREARISISIQDDLTLSHHSYVIVQLEDWLLLLLLPPTYSSLSTCGSYIYCTVSRRCGAAQSIYTYLYVSIYRRRGKR